MSVAAAEHRKLRFQTVSELLAEIDRIIAAEQAGTLRRTGNWTVGQTFGHLATWIEFNYMGFPIKPPWFVKIYLKFMKKKYLREGMPRGVRIPSLAQGTLGTDVLSTDEGATRLRAALDRLQKEPPKFPSPAFGKLSEDERIQLNLRHAELHLGYLHPQ